MKKDEGGKNTDGVDDEVSMEEISPPRISSAPVGDGRTHPFLPTCPPAV